ncbi:BrnA antitoxin family protein [Pseudanabaena biceps]|nr:BrnA antitoxin family protein [Pseudanabaena biceps]
MEPEYDFSKGKRGAIEPVSKGKIRITIRLDDDILKWFRSEANNKGGDNYQTSINEALRQHIHHQSQEPLESILRRVLREELTQSQSN